MARRGKTGGGQGFGAPTPTRQYGSVRTAAGGTRARGGALVLPSAVALPRLSSPFNPARTIARKQAQQILAGRAAPAGGNTGAKKGNDKESASGSAPNKSVYRRARPGEFSQRTRGATARRVLRNLARTGTPATQQRARAVAARVGVRV